MQGPLREDLTRISTPFRGKDKDLERTPPWAGRCDKVRWGNKATPPRRCQLFQRPRVGRPDWQYIWNPRFSAFLRKAMISLSEARNSCTQRMSTAPVSSHSLKPRQTQLTEIKPTDPGQQGPGWGWIPSSVRPRCQSGAWRNHFEACAAVISPTSHNCLRTPRLPATACHGPWTVQKKATFGTSKHRGRRGPFGAPSSPSHLQLCSLMTFGIKVILMDFGQGASTRFLQNDLPSIQEQPLATVTMQAPPQRYLFATKHTVVTRALGLAFARPTTHTQHAVQVNKVTFLRALYFWTGQQDQSTGTSTKVRPYFL